MGLAEQLQDALGADRVQVQMPLAPLTSFKAGGSAEFGYVAQTSAELQLALQTARALAMAVTVLGRGANVLISDRGVPGLVIINRSHLFEVQQPGQLTADSGCDTAVLYQATSAAGLMGFERLLKVPGTLGGAIYMNAGDTGRQSYLGQLVTSVSIIDEQGLTRELSRDECGFGYRESIFQHQPWIIISAILQLPSGTAEQIQAARQDVLERKSHQPPGASCGSTFRNPTGDYAGRLIESTGLKGLTIGGASVSTSHANFIVNDGTATATDIASLIRQIQQTVLDQTGVKLVEEVRYVGDWNQ